MRRLWVAFAAVIVVSFVVLGWMGVRIYQEAPPIPRAGRDDRRRGRHPGGRHRGRAERLAVAGRHGGGLDLGPRQLRRARLDRRLAASRGVFILDDWAQRRAGPTLRRACRPSSRRRCGRGCSRRCGPTPTIRPAACCASIRRAARRSRPTPRTTRTSSHTGKPSTRFPPVPLTDPAKLRQLSAFFFWTSWAASTNRPDDTITYTSNWPHEPLVGNAPTGEAVVWTGVSIIMLLAGIGAMVWYYASQPRGADRRRGAQRATRCSATRPTPSQHATVKYFWIVAGLLLAADRAGRHHRALRRRRDGFYGIPLDKWLPYSVARTWHLQLGIFWIATAWLAAGLFIGPAVSGVEPKGQRLGVNVLFGALLVVVLGSLAGEWLSVKQMLSSGTSGSTSAIRATSTSTSAASGRSRCFIGLFLWLFLVGARDPAGASAQRTSSDRILTLFLDLVASPSPASTAPALDVGPAHPPRRSSSTGAGGSCTSGWKASSRSSPPSSSRSSSRG